MTLLILCLDENDICRNRILQFLYYLLELEGSVKLQFVNVGHKNFQVDHNSIIDVNGQDKQEIKGCIELPGSQVEHNVKYYDDSTEYTHKERLSKYLHNTSLFEMLCSPPFLVKVENENKTKIVFAGLCTVARQLVFIASKSHQSTNCLSLLGYKETCLKGYAEASRWTKFCEVDLISAMQSLRSTLNEKHDHEQFSRVPIAFLQLEKELVSPKKFPNASKYFGPGKCKWDKQLQEKSLNKIHITDVPASVGLEHVPGDSEERTPNEECPKIRNFGTSPYFCDFYITLGDLLIFPLIHEYLMMILNKQLKNLLVYHIPNLIKWFQRVQMRSDILALMTKIGMDIVRYEDLKPSADTECYDIAISQAGQHNESGNIEAVSRPGGKRRNRGCFHAVELQLMDIVKSLQTETILTRYKKEQTYLEILDWSELPMALDPSEGELNPERAQRKRHQIHNILAAVNNLVKPGHVIVDFCAGGGHVGIVIAYFHPKCKVVLVENKEDSVARAVMRIQRLQLDNIIICQSNLDYFTGSFDIGVALHACGMATDLVLDRCLRARASFVVCPCCYGSVKCTDTMKYPRSQLFSSNKVNDTSHAVLAHGADMVTWDFTSEKSQVGQFCMMMIDNDRCGYMTENAYDCRVSIMHPENCSPKNHLIVGTPS